MPVFFFYKILNIKKLVWKKLSNCVIDVSFLVPKDKRELDLHLENAINAIMSCYSFFYI